MSYLGISVREGGEDVKATMLLAPAHKVVILSGACALPCSESVEHAVFLGLLAAHGASLGN